MDKLKKVLTAALVALFLGSLAGCIVVDRPDRGHYYYGRHDYCRYHNCWDRR